MSDWGPRVPESIAQWLWDVQVDGYSIYEWTEYFAQFSDRQWARYARNTYGGRWSEQEWADWFKNNRNRWPPMVWTLDTLGITPAAMLWLLAQQIIHPEVFRRFASWMRRRNSRL